MKKLPSFPCDDGFYMPAEWQQQKQIWLLWPMRSDNWRLGAKPAQATFAKVISTIAHYEPVTVGVNYEQFMHVAYLFQPLDNVRVVELSSNDAWARDCGPTFLQNKQGDIRGVSWEFNAWGGLDSGLYFPWDKDNAVAEKILELESVKCYVADDFVLEGGSIHVDGEGTLLTTEECLLNPNRNPSLSRSQIEANLHQYLGVTKVIWLPNGLFNDETNGHIDNLCCFIRPAEVLLAWCDDSDDPNYDICRDAYHALQNATDAKGRRFIIHKLPLPPALYSKETEMQSIDWAKDSQPRDDNERLAASYINFLMVNNALIVPAFDCETDEIVKMQLQLLFPERKIEMIPSREILLGGGNIHCITQQQPL